MHRNGWRNWRKKLGNFINRQCPLRHHLLVIYLTPQKFPPRKNIAPALAPPTAWQYKRSVSPGADNAAWCCSQYRRPRRRLGVAVGARRGLLWAALAASDGRGRGGQRRGDGGRIPAPGQPVSVAVVGNGRLLPGATTRQSQAGVADGRAGRGGGLLAGQRVGLSPVSVSGSKRREQCRDKLWDIFPGIILVVLLVEFVV